MKVSVEIKPKSTYELTIEVPAEEMKVFVDRAVEKMSQEVKIEGFRPGKATFEVLKAKVGELSIWEEAGYLAINKTMDQAIRENIKEQVVGQPQVNVTKLAPGNSLEYKIVLSVVPEVTLGEYKNFGVKLSDVEVSDDDAKKILADLREMQVRETVSEDAVKDGDKVTVDISMFIDKVGVEGGQSKDTAVVIGKGYVVPGFDKKLIGAKKGEEREFSLPYPAEYHQKNLAGKLVDFKVKVNEVYARELPEMDEKFVARFGLKSLEELTKNIKDSLVKEKEEKSKQKAEIEIIDKMIATAKFGDIPEVLITSESNTMLSELEHNLSHQGAKMEDYLQSLGKTRAQMQLDLLPDAVKRVKSALIIRQIALEEKIVVDEKLIDKEIEAVLGHYAGNAEIEAKVKTHEYRHYVENVMTNQEVMKRLLEWNIKK